MIPPPPLSLPQPVTPNERLRILGEGRLLQIQPTQVSDSGRYLCVATNVAGEDDQDFNVLIQGVWGPTGPGGGTGRSVGGAAWLRVGSACSWSSLAGGLCSGLPAPFLTTVWHVWAPPPGLSLAFVQWGD